MNEKPQNSGEIVERDEKGKYVTGHKKVGGRRIGSKNFDTLFMEAIRKIAEEKKLPIKDPEMEMVVRAVVEALKGNYAYFRDLMDRRYGKPRQPMELEHRGEPLSVRIVLDNGKDNKTPQIPDKGPEE